MIGPVRTLRRSGRRQTPGESRPSGGLGRGTTGIGIDPDALTRRRARTDGRRSSADCQLEVTFPSDLLFYRCRSVASSRTRLRTRTVTRRLQSILTDYSNVTIQLWGAAVRNRSVTLTIPKPLSAGQRDRRRNTPTVRRTAKRAPQGARARAPEGPGSLRRRAPSPGRRGGRSCGWRCSCARRPCETLRMISGWAAFSASAAAAWSPVAIASSTLRTKVRIRERRALLISARRSACSARFLDDGELAMSVGVPVSRRESQAASLATASARVNRQSAGRAAIFRGTAACASRRRPPCPRPGPRWRRARGTAAARTAAPRAASSRSCG